MNRNRNHTYTYAIPQTVIAALSALVVVSAFLYVAFIFTIVHRVAARQHAETAVAEASVHIAELEGQYIALKNSVSEDMALQEGFRTVAARNYVSNRSLGLSARSIE